MRDDGRSLRPQQRERVPQEVQQSLHQANRSCPVYFPCDLHPEPKQNTSSRPSDVNVVSIRSGRRVCVACEAEAAIVH